MNYSLQSSKELVVIVVSLCCSGAFGRRLGGGLFDGGGGEPAGRQQHLRELHSHQQHGGERYRRGDHVSATSHNVEAPETQISYDSSHKDFSVTGA